MSDVNRLRKEVENRLKSVNAKIARTKRNTGANVSGSKFDPRRKSGIENRYNSRQLQSYLNDLNDFMRRGNQFVSGTAGAPLPRGQFNIYKRNEAAVEAIRQRRDREMGGIMTPTGLTIRQQRAALPESAGSSVYGPYRYFDRQPENITSAESLEKLNKDMLKMLRSNYMPDQIEKGRENIRKVAEYLGETTIADQIDDLSDYQFDAMWFGTTFADKLFLYYELEKERAEGTHKERRQDRVIETQFAGIGELIDWAKNQNPGEATERVKGFRR